jgi:hypothetical protein
LGADQTISDETLAAARAAVEVVYGAGWLGDGVEGRTSTKAARLVLAAVVPHIEAAIRSKIAAEIEAAMDEDQRERRKHHDPEPCDNESWECHADGACAAFTQAADVARGGSR